MAVRTQRQLANRRRVERVIRLMAPGLDLLLFAGDRLARVAGRNELDPEPARRSAGPGELRTPIGTGATRSDP